MSRPFALAVAILAAGLSGGCGLQPLYTGGSAGTVAGTLARIEVAPIEGRTGWLVAGALRDRLATSDEPPLYRVVVKLDDDLTALGIRRDDTVTRERRTLRARYQLVDVAQGTVLVDATAGSDVGVDVVGSDYATIAAETTAVERLSGIVADQIVARLARYAQAGRTAAARPPGQP